jgi:hypothetical protein
MSIDKFLIADNPMHEGGTTAIIHTQEPKSILLVDEGHVATKWPHRHYTYHDSEDLDEPYTLSVFHSFVQNMDGEEQNIIIEKLLRNASHWYEAYLEWQDKQIDNEG